MPEGIDKEHSRENPQNGINLQDGVPHENERSMEYFDCGVPKNPYYRFIVGVAQPVRASVS